MSYSTPAQWGPGATSTTIKRLIIWTVTLSLLSATIQSVFDQFDLSPGPVQLLSLSWWGITHLYLWQSFSFLFIQPYTSAGISFYFLISLFFSMYLLWVLGTAVFEIVGKRAFLRFYFFCGITAGLISLLMMPVTGKYAMLAGPAPVILALLTTWSMAYPDTEVLLFFLIPVRAKWIMSGLIGGILFMTLSQWDIANFFLYLPAVIIGYAYACLVWGWQSPFTVTQRIDSILSAIGLKVRCYIKLPKWLKFKNGASNNKDKIVDIGTGKTPSNDDAFIDAMLDKISKDGEGALSWNERRRMQQISERKKTGES